MLRPEIDFKKLLVACPTFGFLVLALTAIPINGAATLTAGLRNLLQAVLCPLKDFLKFISNRTTFKHILMGYKSDYLLAITFRVRTFIMYFQYNTFTI